MTTATIDSREWITGTLQPWAELADTTAVVARSFKTNANEISLGFAEDLMQALGQYSRPRVRFTESLLVGSDEVVDLAITSANVPPIDEVAEVSAPIRSELDEVQSIVRDFERLADGWDEPRSLAPSLDIVQDALIILQNWQISDFIPEPEVSVDGKIVLEIYDKDGFTLGGVELVGAHRAVYSVNWRTEVLGKGSFDTTSQTQIIDALSSFKDLLEKKQFGDAASQENVARRL